MQLEESAAASIAEGEAVYVEPSSWEEEEGEWMMMMVETAVAFAIAVGYYERGVYVDEADYDYGHYLLGQYR